MPFSSKELKMPPPVARFWSENTKHGVHCLDKNGLRTLALNISLSELTDRYCDKYNLGDPEEAFPTTDRARAISFLTFMCENHDINTTKLSKSIRWSQVTLGVARDF